MDDLLGEDWQQSSKQPALRPSNNTYTNTLNILKPTSTSSTPFGTSPLNLSRPSSTAPGEQRSGNATKSNDAFQGLAGLKSVKAANSGLSIQERQRQIVEERQRSLQEQGKLWDNLGGAAVQQQARPQEEDEEDILAAYNKDAKVDKSSHFPPPSLPVSEPVSGRGTPSNGLQSAFAKPAVPAESYGGFDDDDDTFGLKALRPSNGHATKPARSMMNDDDDILGDLSRPAQPRPPARTETGSPDSERWDENVASSRSTAAHSSNAALAELVDMGFPEENAAIALAENDGDVQVSVGWLLQQAHAESKQKMQEQRDASQSRSGRSPVRRPQEDFQRRPNGSAASPAPEKDASQIAQELGSRFLKSAGSLWKAGQKQVAKTVADFQQERKSDQPKWMQNGQATQRRQEQNGQSDLTNEAAMLDMPREEPHQASKPAVREQRLPVQFRRESPAPARSPQPQFIDRRPEQKLTRQLVEEQTAQAYVSPARRKQTKPKPEPVVDLFSPVPDTTMPAPKSSNHPSINRPVPTIKPRPAVPIREIPATSASALATSSRHRKLGTDAFKRGDYGAAHEAYTAAVQPLPSNHPLLIVILSNRSLTALKTGDAKTAVSDADRAIEIIGPGLGVDEKIEIEPAEPAKDLREFYGKALMRKAEALEHMERWSEAAAVWRLAVEAGAGGAVSIRGRDRCEKAANPAPVKAASKPKPAPPAKSLGNSVTRPKLPTPVSDSAVKKLREANAAAEKADDEKFQLTDKVDAQIVAWKGGKADNLRALLQSLDLVLWESAGWKKVGMSDLVMPNKVKIVYMKAIAKVHPDKIAQDASTEQRMISSAVFSTLNEAWDKFKKDNNL